MVFVVAAVFVVGLVVVVLFVVVAVIIVGKRNIFLKFGQHRVNNK